MPYSWILYSRRPGLSIVKKSNTILTKLFKFSSLSRFGRSFLSHVQASRHMSLHTYTSSGSFLKSSGIGGRHPDSYQASPLDLPYTAQGFPQSIIVSNHPWHKRTVDSGMYRMGYFKIELRARYLASFPVPLHASHSPLAVPSCLLGGIRC